MLENQNETSGDNFDLARQVSSGANWFYWIAALTLVNSAVTLFEGNWGFAVGLGITQLIDAVTLGIAHDNGTPSLKFVALMIDLVFAGLFALFGVFANKRNLWAFVAGMVIYLLDTAIFIFAGDILGIVLHALALFFLVKGFMAARMPERFAAHPNI